MIQLTHPERATFIHSSISSAWAPPPPLPDALSSDRSSATYSSSGSTTSSRSSRATTMSASAPSSASARRSLPSSRQMRMEVGVSGADVEAAAAAASAMASIRVRACAGKRGRKVKGKILVVQWEGAAASSKQQGGGKGGVRSAECGWVRASTARNTGTERGIPSLLSYTLARVHRGGEMSSWRGREMRGGAVRVCVECGRWRASVGRLEEKRDTGRERETETEGRGFRACFSTAVFASVPLTSPPGSTWYRWGIVSM